MSNDPLENMGYEHPMEKAESAIEAAVRSLSNLKRLIHEELKHNPFHRED